jgi:putative tryptophan/tyrosine transport system permease protein
MIQGILTEGFIYGIMTLGVFITFRVLDFPDLTVDGSFPLGAAVLASMIVSGAEPWVAIMVAFGCGLIAGFVTAAIHNHLKVPNLLAGILTMTMLYSVNIRIMGNRANLPLLRVETTLSKVTESLSGALPEEWGLVLFLVILVGFVVTLLGLFFRTDLGLTLGALGNNEQMVITQGVNPNYLKVIGVGLSNGIVAVSGGFAAQYLGFADVNMGQGIIIAGLASVMIGEFFIRSTRISVLLIRAIIGSIIFRGIMFVGRFYGYYINLTPNDLKLITGLLIILFLAASRLRITGRKGAKRNG